MTAKCNNVFCWFDVVNKETRELPLPNNSGRVIVEQCRYWQYYEEGNYNNQVYNVYCKVIHSFSRSLDEHTVDV